MCGLCEDVVLLHMASSYSKSKKGWHNLNFFLPPKIFCDHQPHAPSLPENLLQLPPVDMQLL
jgi:hypothetical protein